METENAGLKALGGILSLEREGSTVCLKLEGAQSQAKLRFLDEGVVRFSFDPEGKFEDATNGKIIAPGAPSGLAADKLDMEETADAYVLKTEKVTLKLLRGAFRMEAYRPDGGVYFREAQPLQYGEKSTVQTLEGAKEEYFYGGGMQNGYFSHKGRKISAELMASHWNAGSVSNPAPFFMSSKGYGEFRNTFKEGSYSFLEETVLTQSEGVLDVFYFFGSGIQDVLNEYTRVTGRPHLIPRWGLMPGDANCYKETMDAMKTVEGYEENNFPKGWILPNDGYGCGYTDLKGFVAEAEKHGFKVGLWTENSVDKIAQEVKELGSRLVKTDVAWVGPGYEFALDGVKTSCDGVEDNSPDRGYVWTCCGWAGTQRYSTAWSGDQFGNWEYIRMHIPTYIGSGLSGNPYAGSDVDGIFAGSAETQVRDLQWKCFTPILIFMSGWAPKNKQPWVWGEPYASINRKYLNLKLRLSPYMYTLAYKSSLTGEPIMKPVLWNYPEGKYAFTKDTQYQFLLGDSFLVAPVYEDTDTRDAIFLPGADEIWIDYHTGEQYKGGQVLNSFHAPLEKLPLFVRSGSVIPMYPEGHFDGEVMPDEAHPLTLDIYPRGKQEFTLYEDDGRTKEHTGGAFAQTAITVSAPTSGTGALEVSIGAAQGSYTGMNETRCYELKIHTNCAEAGAVRAALGSTAPGSTALGSVESSYEETEAGGVLTVKLGACSVREAVSVHVEKVCSEAAVAVTDSIVPSGASGLRVEKAEDRKLILAWDEAKDAKWYDLEVDGLLYTHVSNPYHHRELECETEYTYRLRACNTCGASEWSAQMVAKTEESSLRDALVEADYEKVEATNNRPGYECDKAINGDGESFWRTSEKDDNELPATVTMDLKQAWMLNRFEYKSREKGVRGNITKYSLAVSIDGKHYKEIVENGTWEDQNEPHMVEFGSSEMAQHVRIVAHEGVQGSANAVHLTPYRTPDTTAVIPGNYTGGDTVDENDLTFLRNYMGVFKADNDWGYVSKCDINYNGMIDAYDLAFVASKLDGGITGEGAAAEGKISVELPTGPVKAGDTFEVRVMGEGLKNVYAFHAMLNMDESKFEHHNCTGRCKKEVVARSGDLTGGELVNASTIKSDENGAKVVVAFTGKGAYQGMSGSGELAVFTLQAKEDIATVELPLLTAMLVGTDRNDKEIAG